MSKASTRQTLSVLVFAVLIIFVAAGTTVYVSTQFNTSSSEEEGYKNVTYTDAVLTCEAEGRAEFGQRLDQLIVDRHSSRFESDVFLYKIFLKAYTKTDIGEVTEFFLTCFVKSSNGRISKFDVFENVKGNEGGAIKQGGEKFIEWPQ